MIKANRFLLDTNVWIDYFCGNDPDGSIAGLLELSVRGAIDILYAPTSAKDVFYIIPRRLKRAQMSEGCSRESYNSVSWACLEAMMELGVAAPQSFAECEMAKMLRGSYCDFEDNLIMAAGETAKADFVVTSDRGMLESMPEACMTPARALELARRN